GVQGRRYTTSLSAVGGTPPYRWALVGGALPSGLSLSASGVVDGVPNFSGASTFAAHVADSSKRTLVATKWLTLTMRPNSSSEMPIVTGIKVKGLKKLWVFGVNFRANSL